MDEGYIDSKLELSYYVDREDVQRLLSGEKLQALSISSYMSAGSVPYYEYTLNLSKFHSLDRILNIKKRIKGDKDFLIWSLSSKTSQILRSDESVDEHTMITIKFIFTKNKGASEPEIVTKVNPLLQNLKYKFKVDQFGESYFWRKGISKQVKLPNDWFSKTRKDGRYLLKVAHYPEVRKMISEFFESKVQEEYQKLKLIFPDLSEFVKDAGNFSYKANSGKISVTIYSKIPDKYDLTDTFTDFDLYYNIHYWNRKR